MNRRLILVDLCWTRDKDPRIPLGHASLLAMLRSVGTTEIRSLVVPVNATATDTLSTRVEGLATAIMDLASGFEGDAVDVAIGVYVWGEDVVQGLLPRLRASGFSGRIILGGPQISYAGEGVDRVYPDADAFVRGYGELALSELATTPGQPQIAGVTYRGRPDRGEQTATDLDRLPSP